MFVQFLGSNSTLIFLIFGLSSVLQEEISFMPLLIPHLIRDSPEISFQIYIGLCIALILWDKDLAAAVVALLLNF